MQYIGTGRLGATQSVSYSGTAGTIANGVGPQTHRVRVVCTTDAFIRIDNNPTAVANDAPLPAMSAEYFTITPGQKVSAIQLSANGTLYVTEIS